MAHSPPLGSDLLMNLAGHINIGYLGLRSDGELLILTHDDSYPVTSDAREVARNTAGIDPDYGIAAVLCELLTASS